MNQAVCFPEVCREGKCTARQLFVGPHVPAVGGSRGKVILQFPLSADNTIRPVSKQHNATRFVIYMLSWREISTFPWQRLLETRAGSCQGRVDWVFRNVLQQSISALNSVDHGLTVYGLKVRNAMCRGT